jgi:hypothetical protein
MPKNLLPRRTPVYPRQTQLARMGLIERLSTNTCVKVTQETAPKMTRESKSATEIASLINNSVRVVPGLESVTVEVARPSTPF